MTHATDTAPEPITATDTAASSTPGGERARTRSQAKTTAKPKRQNPPSTPARVRTRASHARCTSGSRPNKSALTPADNDPAKAVMAALARRFSPKLLCDKLHELLSAHRTYMNSAARCSLVSPAVLPGRQVLPASLNSTSPISASRWNCARRYNATRSPLASLITSNGGPVLCQEQRPGPGQRPSFKVERRWLGGIRSSGAAIWALTAG